MHFPFALDPVNSIQLCSWDFVAHGDGTSDQVTGSALVSDGLGLTEVSSALWTISFVPNARVHDPGLRCCSSNSARIPGSASLPQAGPNSPSPPLTAHLSRIF